MKKSEALNILGLHEGASEEDIKKAHRKKVIENHPDRFQDPTKKARAEEKTKLINEARDVLLSGRWDPEFSSGAGSYGNPYRSPYGNPYQQGPTRGGAQQGDEWPFGFGPNTWTVWGTPNQQGGNRQGTYDPFNPFAQQQASVDAATRAKQEAESDIKVGVAMLVVKLVVCGGLALTGQWLAAALIWSILTFMLLAAGRFGGCIWLFLFPVFFMFSDMISMANAQQGNIAVIVPIAASFIVAIGFDIRDFREAYRRYRVTSGKKTWKEKRTAGKRDKREAKSKAKAAKAQTKADAKKAKHTD